MDKYDETLLYIFTGTLVLTLLVNLVAGPSKGGTGMFWLLFGVIACGFIASGLWFLFVLPSGFITVLFGISIGTIITEWYFSRGDNVE
jgi:hypothetical protein